MNVLITGACGYIGSHFTQYMVKNYDYNFFAVDNLTTGRADVLPESVKLYVADLSDHKCIKKIICENKIDAIFHFAGKIIVSESVEKPFYYYSENTFNTASLAEIAEKNGVKYFIFSSTAAVYGEPDENENVSENSITSPRSPYGASKLMSERIIQDICKNSEMKFGLLRYFNVVGASPDLSIGSFNKTGTHLVKKCCDTILGKCDKLFVYGSDYPTVDGTGVRDYIHVCDLVSAHDSVFKYLQNGGSSDIFNVGYSTGFSVMQVIDVASKVSGKNIPYEIKSRRAGDCARVVSCNRKILEKTDWKPVYNDIETMVKHSYLWAKKLNDMDV